MNKNLLNPSDKTRSDAPDSSKHILPHEDGYKDEKSGWAKYKWWIIGGAALIIVGVVLGLTLEGGGGDNPVPPPPPTPSDYNPYNVIPTSITNYEYKMTGYFAAQPTEIERLNSEYKVGDQTLIKADPRMIPTGPNN